MGRAPRPAWHPSQREAFLLRAAATEQWESSSDRTILVSLIRLGGALSASALAFGLAAVAPAMAQAPTPVKVLLDWAWLPYHAPFLIAQDKG